MSQGLVHALPEFPDGLLSAPGCPIRLQAGG